MARDPGPRRSSGWRLPNVGRNIKLVSGLLMIARGMKVLIPARHGLGDVLAGYFINPTGRTILARVNAGLRDGIIVSAMMVYEHWYNPSTGALLRGLPCDIKVRSTSELAEVRDQDADNRMPPAVRWHQNVYTNPPAQFSELDGSNWLACPTIKPPVDLPDRYVLFSDGASARDRVLTDRNIYNFLRQCSGLPIVKVGNGHDEIPADINLCNKLSILETLYLAHKAVVIVSGASMLRTASALFGTPVLEVLEHATSNTIKRTQWEYDAGLYGMTGHLNKWFFWPRSQSELRSTLRSITENGNG